MKNFLYVVLSAVFVFFFLSADVSACSATGMVDRAEAVRDSDVYDTASDVVRTDPEIASLGWDRPEADDAAIGTVLREFVNYGWWNDTNGNGTQDAGEVLCQSPGYWQADGTWHENTDSQYTFGPGTGMEDATFVRWFIGYATGSLSSIGHGTIGISTVRDHAIFHGNEWETGYDQISGEPLGPWYNPPADPAHGG